MCLRRRTLNARAALAGLASQDPSSIRHVLGFVVQLEEQMLVGDLRRGALASSIPTVSCRRFEPYQTDQNQDGIILSKGKNMRCKVGDLALLIRSLTGANDGKIVTVVEYIGHFNANDIFEHNNLKCRVPITDHYWWIYCPAGLTTPYGECAKAYSPDIWLKPLPPDILGQNEETGDEVYNSRRLVTQ